MVPIIDGETHGSLPQEQVIYVLDSSTGKQVNINGTVTMDKDRQKVYYTYGNTQEIDYNGDWDNIVSRLTQNGYFNDSMPIKTSWFKIYIKGDWRAFAETNEYGKIYTNWEETMWAGRCEDWELGVGGSAEGNAYYDRDIESYAFGGDCFNYYYGNKGWDDGKINRYPAQAYKWKYTGDPDYDFGNIERPLSTNESGTNYNLGNYSGSLNIEGDSSYYYYGPISIGTNNGGNGVFFTIRDLNDNVYDISGIEICNSSKAKISGTGYKFNDRYNLNQAYYDKSTFSNVWLKVPKSYIDSIGNYKIFVETYVTYTATSSSTGRAELKWHLASGGSGQSIVTHAEEIYRPAGVQTVYPNVYWTVYGSPNTPVDEPEPEDPKAKYQIIKRDAYGGITFDSDYEYRGDSDNVLKDNFGGIEFKLYCIENNEGNKNCWVRKYDNSGNPVYNRYQCGENDGYIRYNSSYSTAYALTTYPAGQTETLSQLVPGRYRVYETKIPDSLMDYYHYNLDEEYTINGETLRNVKLIDEFELVASGVTHTTIENSRTSTNLKIVKKDEITEKKLKGIRFKILDITNDADYKWITAERLGSNKILYHGTTSTYKDKDVISHTSATSGDILYSTFETDKNGEILIRGLPRYHTYRIFEVDLGSYTDYYSLDNINIYLNKNKTKSIQKNAKIVPYESSTYYTSPSAKGLIEVEVKNKPTGILQIKKADERTGILLKDSDYEEEKGFQFKIKVHNDKSLNYTDKVWLTWDENTFNWKNSTATWSTASILETGADGITPKITKLPIYDSSGNKIKYDIYEIKIRRTISRLLYFR